MIDKSWGCVQVHCYADDTKFCSALNYDKSHKLGKLRCLHKVNEIQAPDKTLTLVDAI